jgi:hypothetical protein
MIFIFFTLFSSSLVYASEAQKQFDLAWGITKNEIVLSASSGAENRLKLFYNIRDLSNCRRQANRDVRWQTVKNLPEPLKDNFFNLVRNAAINNPQDYWFIRNLIAGCAYAGCIIKAEGCEEERLISLMIKKNDVQLLGSIDIQ